MRIASYSPHPAQVARGDYFYSGQHGMGAVTPPEAIVSGEGYSRTVNQFQGMGFWSVDELKAKLTQTKNELTSTGGVLGICLGLAAGVWLGKFMASRRRRTTI